MTVGTIAILLRSVGWAAIAGFTICACAVGACGVVLVHDFVGPPLLATAFVLLAAASAFALEEPASEVVDVAPAGPAAQTAARAVALTVPLCGGLTLILATALRAPTFRTPDMGLALVGNVLIGFAIASMARLRTGEPGVLASSAAAFVLIVPSVYGPLSRRIHTFPIASPTSNGLSSNTWWWLAGAASLLAITIAVRSDRAYRPTRDAQSRLQLVSCTGNS